jgi:transcriptional regulator with XRE-family HTH domain
MDGAAFLTTQEIGAVVRRRRKQLKLSQETLAGKLGISHQQVQRYENGTDRLNVENLQKVAHALSVPIYYFFLAEGFLEEADEVEFRDLLECFRKIQKRELRSVLVEFAKSCANIDELKAEG